MDKQLRKTLINKLTMARMYAIEDCARSALSCIDEALATICAEPEAQCDPTRTECPRCRNDLRNAPTDCKMRLKPEAQAVVETDLRKDVTLPTEAALVGAMERTLSDAEKGMRVLSTILKHAKLAQGFAVADEILGNIGNVRKVLKRRLEDAAAPRSDEG